jgi:hypothetical protein
MYAILSINNTVMPCRKASFERPPNSAASLPANQQRGFFDRAQAIELPMKMTLLRAENNLLPAVREI